MERLMPRLIAPSQYPLMYTAIKMRFCRLTSFAMALSGIATSSSYKLNKAGLTYSPLQNHWAHHDCRDLDILVGGHRTTLPLRPLRLIRTARLFLLLLNLGFFLTLCLTRILLTLCKLTPKIRKESSPFVLYIECSGCDTFEAVCRE